jgi:hypothetical protein
MPEEIEVPTEHLHEAIHEAAHGGGGGSFNMQVALSSALVAVLAAVCALFAGAYANEAVVNEIKSANTWSYYQSKSIKSSVLASKADLLQALGRKAGEADLKKLEEYKAEMEEIKAEAEKLTHEAEALLHRHETLAKGVTLFQIAIALSAISVLTKKRFLWLGGLGLSLGGVFFLIKGLL